jgi:hypothetical protein
VSDNAKTWIRIFLTVLSVVLPFGLISSVLADKGGPTTDEQGRLLGKMVAGAIVFVVFGNLTIWGWRKPSAPKH